VAGSAVAAAGGVHGFPAALTSFIGRSGPLREVAGLLGRHRLVTVTGAGGSGKTRLACEVARQVSGRFADGAWLVELAPVQDPAQVAPAVAAVLGVREQPGVAAADAVARVLARQQMLLVLDNCEHVIGAAAELCARLLTACDDVRVLATSREPLAVAGEGRYRLGPLSLPSAGGAGNAGGSEAVALFVDRALSADAHFEPGGETGAAVATIVARLDGMPLAIELAAARVEALGVGQLLERLDDRFALLAGGDRLAADRQRSLAATVDWSYQLLTGEERRVFRQLSVFPGPFTLEGAGAVAGEGAAAVVVRLVDCSLLSPPRAGPDGQARYLMLETLRGYGAGRLAEEREQDAAASALAGYALAVAEDAAAGLQSMTGEVAAARRLDAEDATLRQVLVWAVEHDPAVALRLADALGWWWLARGRLVSHYSLLRQAARQVEVGSHGWCVAQYWLGYTAYLSADLAGALEQFTAFRDAVEGGGPSRALADALAGRSAALRELGRLAEAADDARRSLAMARGVGYPAGEVLALANLSFAAWHAADHHSAVQLARQAAQITDGIPGTLARFCGYMLTIVLTEAGDLAAAERVSAAALPRCRHAGDLFNQLGLLTRMAFLDLQAGRLEDAAAHLQEASQIGVRTGNRAELFAGLESCGHLCASTGRPAEAITAWAAADAISRREGFQESPEEARRWEEPLRQARHALGDTRARAAEERGAAMSPETAAEYALMLTSPDPQPPTVEAGGRKLSAREKELVTLVARGRTDAQIAAQLYISVRTVSSHLDRIRDKTGCRRRADLTRLALQQGLV
jgi:predicted ATPase/DNA-binding CsgD family transcriptional regulator